MGSDYAAIKAENERRYGTDIGRIGPMLLSDRYDDRTHFIYELLQNAEDALSRRSHGEGQRSVEFMLSQNELRVSHFGAPFNEADVRGICGILDSTKDRSAIGRFGIGFKSVYAFTDSPEVHSGGEHFAIDSFVWPRAVRPADVRDGETVFFLPFRSHDTSAVTDITSGFRKLGPRTMLFLKEIEEISWVVEGGSSGLYLRGKPEPLADNARKVSIIGQEHGTEYIEETWLIFSRNVVTDNGVHPGHVEVAFSLVENEGSKTLSIKPADDSTLVVYFPTIVPTNLGFLVQGPFHTTPSRDNIIRKDPVNKDLIRETAELIVDALRGLRTFGLLDVDVLRCLPLDSTKFEESSMIAPFFHAVRDALSTEPLLPCFKRGHVSASSARLARTQELRELFNPDQLGNLLEEDKAIYWLSGEITQDRTPELRKYLMGTLNINEIVPETILPRLTKTFLEEQKDDWIVQLYEFLYGQSSRLRSGKMMGIPLVRLEDGTHTVPYREGQPQAFLPGIIDTGFPTVRKSVCITEGARAFLSELGLTEPDPVDDVILNILPKYKDENVKISDIEYQTDIERFLKAFSVDSKSQREKLLNSLRNAYFVAAVSMDRGTGCFRQPSSLYIATQRLKDLFRGVPGVLMVDDKHECLRGEDIRDLLEACGAARSLRTVPIESSFTQEELSEMRKRAGTATNTGLENIEDFTIYGLEQLLNKLSAFSSDEAMYRAELLWEALCDLEERKGSGAFLGTYKWFYVQKRSCTFNASFVRVLNERAWVPDENRNLQKPQYVFFESLGQEWKLNPFLLSIIKFKPPIIELLAKEVGIEPGVLDLLKKHGVISVADLMTRLGIQEEEQKTQGSTNPISIDDALQGILGDMSQPTPPVPDPAGLDSFIHGSGVHKRTNAGIGSGPGEDVHTGERSETGGYSTSRRSVGSSGGRPFISYVGTHPNEEESDPDGLDQQARIAIEEKAIEHILEKEPQLERTSTNNPGYDLFEAGSDGHPKRWIEVKAMTGSLNDRPAGLSHIQFECAREHRGNYWLYVVEHVGVSKQTRILRIQDPAGNARTFTFDHGWLCIAEISCIEPLNSYGQSGEENSHGEDRHNKN